MGRTLFDDLDRRAQDTYGHAGNSSYWLQFSQKVVAAACAGRSLHRSADRFRVLVDTFEDEFLAGSDGGLDRLSDREWLNLRPRVTEMIRAAAKEARASAVR